MKAERGSDGKLALFAQIDPTQDLVVMNQARQKLFSSVEIDPNFADTGEAYLVGMAVTDSPASLGTEMLAFCNGLAEKNPLNARKQKAENLFTAAEEFILDLEAEQPQPGPSILEKVRELLSGRRRQDADVHGAIEALAEGVRGQSDQLLRLAQAADVEALGARLRALEAQHQVLVQQLAQQPASDAQPIPPAPGGNTVLTDC